MTVEQKIEMLEQEISELKKIVEELYENENNSTNYGNVVEPVVYDTLKQIGIPAKLSGYRYLATAIDIVAKNPSKIRLITKFLYPEVAEIHETTVQRAERAIRNAVEIAWDRGDVETIHKLFGNSVHPNKDKATNAEFIATVAEYVRGVMNG